MLAETVTNHKKCRVKKCEKKELATKIELALPEGAASAWYNAAPFTLCSVVLLCLVVLVVWPEVGIEKTNLTHFRFRRSGLLGRGVSAPEIESFTPNNG